jgi:hypothetical protein
MNKKKKKKKKKSVHKILPGGVEFQASMVS